MPVEDCKDQDGQKKSVKSRDHRRADDLRVTHDFGYAEGCKRDAGHDVRADTNLIERQLALKHRQQRSLFVVRVLAGRHD